MDIAVKVENVAKTYRLGLTHSSSLRETVNGFFRRVVKGKQTPVSVSDGSDPERLDSDGLFWALKDVSLNVPRGEIMGLIGRNGAGKSTLLKVLSRITSPSAGKVIMRGRVASLLEVGTGFHPELTGRENVFLNGTILGMTKAEVNRNFDAIVDFAAVDNFIDTPVKRYSSGMKVRLGFAVAAHLDPEILIVDEVLSVGDLAFQRKCLSKMRSVAGTGRTVMFVSHNLAAVQNLCQTGVVLDYGQVVYQGRADEAVSDYARRYAPANSSGLPPAQDDSPVEATRIAFLDLDGNEIDQVTFGDQWGIRIEFTVTKTVERLQVGMGVRTTTELGVYSSYAETARFEPGNYVAEFWEDDLSFCCGTYLIAVGLSEDNRSLHYIGDAAQLNIVPGSTGGEKSIVQTHGIVARQLRSTVKKV